MICSNSQKAMVGCNDLPDNVTWVLGIDQSELVIWRLVLRGLQLQSGLGAQESHCVI